MEKNSENTIHKDPLKEEEDRLLEKSIIRANKEAVRKLREQQIQLLKQCVLSSDSEGESKLDIEKMDKEWLEESNRTLVLETVYDNLRMREANNTYKNTSLIKNKEGELYRVTTMVMTEKLSKQASDSTEIKGTIKIKNQKCDIKYKYVEEEQNTVQC